MQFLKTNNSNDFHKSTHYDVVSPTVIKLWQITKTVRPTVACLCEAFVILSVCAADGCSNFKVKIRKGKLNQKRTMAVGQLIRDFKHDDILSIIQFRAISLGAFC